MTLSLISRISQHMPFLITYVISSFLRSLAWSLGLGLGIEASPRNFFSSKFSKEFTGSFWRKKYRSTEGISESWQDSCIWRCTSVSNMSFGLKTQLKFLTGIVHKINNVYKAISQLFCTFILSEKWEIITHGDSFKILTFWQISNYRGIYRVQ